VTLSMVKALLPVTALHLIGHVAGCASYNFSSISFMQIVKAAEPVVSVLTLTALYGQRFSRGIWLSLIPIVAGVAVVSATEVNFAWAGFATAMVSNFAFVFRNIKSKEAQSDIGLQGINLYAWMSILGTALLLPVTLALEGGAARAALESATSRFAASGAVPFLWLGPNTSFIAFLLTGGLFYHLYNQTSYMALTGISPLTYSICNTVKRVVVIIAGIAVFRNPVPPINAVASAVAIAGTWFYAQAETKAKADAAAAKAGGAKLA
jgi:solute carrier family 35 protein E1